MTFGSISRGKLEIFSNFPSAIKATLWPPECPDNTAIG